MFNPADRALPPPRDRRRDRALLAILVLVSVAVVLLSGLERGSARPASSPVAMGADRLGSTEGITISEFVALNRGGLRDEDGDTPGWIELHNASESTVNLKGWALTDQKQRWNKWVLPEKTLDPGAYVVVFASGKNRRNPEGELHTNFRLDEAGEYLALFNPNARPQSVFIPRYPRQTANASFGRDDEGRLAYFSPPTPGAPPTEGAAYEGVIAPLRFSHERGLYADAFSVTIAASTPDATIAYTLDGASPSDEGALAYRHPIPIDRTTVVRAVATRPGYLPSPEAARSFVFPAKVRQQRAPDTYPQTWGEGLPGDYEMDPRSDSDAVEAALRSIPTISIAMNPVDLFDPATGIYMNTEQDGVAWERPCSVELFDPRTGETFHESAGIRIQGRSSRKPATSPKHSFRLLFKTDYGAGTLRYSVFGDDGPDAFETLVLRATSNYSWTFPLVEQRVRAQYVRDVWAKDTQRAMGHPSANCRYAHLYLNGLYWGLYVISERPDAAFMESRTGVTAEAFDVHKGGEVVDGNDRAWKRLFALVEQGVESDAAWSELQRYLDLDSFIDFMILNHYAGNQNWDYGNWYAARDRTGDTGFRFFVWDMESILGRLGENVVYTRNVDRPTELFHQLRRAERFREAFARRALLHLTGDGSLTPVAASRRYLERSRQIETAIVAESARWGDYRQERHPYRTGPFERYTKVDHWEGERNRLIEYYFPERSAVLLQQYERAGLLGAMDYEIQ